MQVLGSYLQIDAAHAPDVVFAHGAAAAEHALEELFARLRRAPQGRVKARLARSLAGRMRELAGLRESPKFIIVRVTSIVREILLAAGRDLVASGTLAASADVFLLHAHELRRLAAGEAGEWRALVDERRRLLAAETRRRQVPRLLLSDGTAFYEGYVGPVNTGSIAGAPVSPGVVEGAAHVVLDPHGTRLSPGEILVCRGTDPAWTPLFLAAGGLVMEVGGMMTHGSVVAREYGIPAVVGVSRATTRLRTGMRIRVDGSTGEIVILSGGAGDQTAEDGI
jgi:pyruvate,water dikinase